MHRDTAGSGVAAGRAHTGRKERTDSSRLFSYPTHGCMRVCMRAYIQFKEERSDSKPREGKNTHGPRQCLELSKGVDFLVLSPHFSFAGHFSLVHFLYSFYFIFFKHLFTCY